MAQARHPSGRHPATEEELLDFLRRELPRPSADVVTGIGDDCAVVVGVAGNGFLELLKTDAVVEGIHFAMETPSSLVGWKALCRPLSDIAAMGGFPGNALITVAAPSHWGHAEWRSLYRGIARAARQFHISIVGGETARSPGPLFISVALTGRVRRKHLRQRSGGCPGDLICVTGRLGGAFKSGRHLRFHPRVHEGSWLGTLRGVTAMMDLSDGLGSDLPKLARASGCSFQIDPGSLPLHRGCSVQEAVSDGEDYELLVTLHPSQWKPLQAKWRKLFPRLPLTCIGKLTPGGTPSTPIASGYDHLHQ